MRITNMFDMRNTRHNKKTEGEQLQLNLLENAFDYMLHAAKCASDDSQSSWKYAILHLVSAIELLVKARLQIEHWSLLFSQVNEASLTKLESGNFMSVDFETSLERLRNIAGVEIEGGKKLPINNLRRFRNRIQHFDVALDIGTVRSLTGISMNFALDFYDAQLRDRDKVDAEYIEQIHIFLREFNEFVGERLQSINAELSAWESVQCPICYQITLVVGDNEPHCLFCNYTTSSNDLAYDISEGIVETCPECSGEFLAFVLVDGEEGRWICTSCGETDRDYERCYRCDQLMIGKGAFCEECVEWIMEKG